MTGIAFDVHRHVSSDTFHLFLQILGEKWHILYVRAFETPYMKRTESFALHMRNPVYGKQREERHIGFYSALPFRAVRCVLCPTRFARSESSCSLAILAASLCVACRAYRKVPRSARSKCRKCIVRNGRVSSFRSSHRRHESDEKIRKREQKTLHFKSINFYCRANVLTDVKGSHIITHGLYE